MNKYTVISASNGRSFQIEGIDADGQAFATPINYSSRADAYAAAEKKGWKPADEDVLARRKKVLGY